MSDDIADEVNILDPSPLAEHDEWEQAIKDDSLVKDETGKVIGNLMTVNERYRVRQSANDFPRVWCGTCNQPLEQVLSILLVDLLEVAKQHEAEVHS